MDCNLLSYGSLGMYKYDIVKLPRPLSAHYVLEGNKVCLINCKSDRHVVVCFNTDKSGFANQGLEVGPFMKTSSDISKRALPSIGYWYDDYIIAFGRQTITSTNKKRHVYYINKIRYLN